MPVAIRFVAQYLRRHPFRIIVSVLGVALAFAVLNFIYGIGGTVVSRSSKALSLAVGDADYWAVPSSGVQLDPETGLIIGNGMLSSQQLEYLNSIDNTAQVEPVFAQSFTIPSFGSVALYGIGTLDGRTAKVSKDIWTRLDGKPGTMNLNGKQIDVSMGDAQLPYHTIVVSITTAWDISGDQGHVSWLWIKTHNAGRWQNQTNPPFVMVATPLFVPKGSNGLPLVYAVTHAVSRFSPFSFDTQFASLVLDRTVSSTLGRVALVVVLLSLVTSVTSAMIGLEEKRDVIAVLSVHGNIGETLFICFAEAGIIHIAGYVLGTTAGVFALHHWVLLEWDWSAIGMAFVLPLLYLPLFVICCTLVMGQNIMGRSTAMHLKKYV